VTTAIGSSLNIGNGAGQFSVSVIGGSFFLFQWSSHSESRGNLTVDTTALLTSFFGGGASFDLKLAAQAVRQ